MKPIVNPSPKILIIDDSIDVHQVMKSLLSHWEYGYVPAHSKAEAIKRFEEHSDISLAFVDGNLVSGAFSLDTEDLVRHIRRHRPQVKLVAYSSNSSWNQKLVTAGCDGALSKPARDIDDIKNMIIVLLS